MWAAIGFFVGAVLCGALATGFVIVGLAAATGENCAPDCGGWVADIAGPGIIVSLVLGAACFGLGLYRLRRDRAD